MSNSTAVAKFTNISARDFTHPFEGEPISVRAGQSRLMPAHVADHLATHLARRILLDAADGKAKLPPGTPGESAPLWSETQIAALKAKIVSEVYEREPEAVVPPEQKVRHDIDQLNANFDNGGAPVIAEPETYRDKHTIIVEMEALGLTVDPRLSAAELERQLVEASQNVAKEVPVPVSDLTPQME